MRRRASMLGAAWFAMTGGCGGGLQTTEVTCPEGRTFLDGVCVAESVADYVSCVRAQGAQLGGARSQQISADVGYLGVNAGGAAEVSESLEKKYDVSDEATMEIIRNCNAAAGIAARPIAKPNPTPATAATSTSLNCGGKRLEVGGRSYCYYADAAPWDAAQRKCTGDGGQLVSIDSMKENQALLTAIGPRPQRYLWLGYNDAAEEGRWTWVSGKPSGFANWNDGEPNNAGDEDCADWNSQSGRWNDADCSNPRGYLCENTASCDGVALEVGGRNLCAEDRQLSWEAAKQRCQGLGGTLASIGSARENRMLFAKLGNAAVWIGLNDRGAEGRFVGPTGAPSFTNWNDGEPNNAGDEDCAEMYPDTGRWNDGVCSTERPFICEAR